MPHTPGPWTVVVQPSGSTLVSAWRVVMPHVIQSSSFTRRDDYGDTCYHGVQISEDDANLIAAAPDLLAVARRLVESAAYWSEYDVPLGIVDDLRAAIAKAEGGAS